MQTFASTLGQAVWLMTMSKDHRDLPISSIEKNAATAIFLRHFKLYSKGKQPIAFLTWASVSDEVKKRIESGNNVLELAEWRSGTNIVIIDCVSPFGPTEVFEAKFLEDVSSL